MGYNFFISSFPWKGNPATNRMTGRNANSSQRKQEIAETSIHKTGGTEGTGENSSEQNYTGGGNSEGRMPTGSEIDEVHKAYLLRTGARSEVL